MKDLQLVGLNGCISKSRKLKMMIIENYKKFLVSNDNYHYKELTPIPYLLLSHSWSQAYYKTWDLVIPLSWHWAIILYVFQFNLHIFWLILIFSLILSKHFFFSFSLSLSLSLAFSLSLTLSFSTQTFYYFTAKRLKREGGSREEGKGELVRKSW